MKPQALKIDYRLTGSGWAECDITCNSRRVSISASYLSDALGQLAGAVLLMRQGAPSARVSFDEEPGEYRWGFDWHNSPNGDVISMRVRIWWFAELWGHRPDSEGEIRFDEVIDTPSVYRAVLQMLDDVLATHGLEGYLSRWVEYPFPKGQHDELRRLFIKWPGPG